MDLYFRCSICSHDDVWRIKTHGTRPMARTMIGDICCPTCGKRMEETLVDGMFRVHDMRRNFDVKREYQ